MIFLLFVADGRNSLDGVRGVEASASLPARKRSSGKTKTAYAKTVVTRSAVAVTEP